MKLENKRVWVTGASSGIGQATAVALAAEGAEVILSARRRDRLDQIAKDIQTAGGRAVVKPLDVTDRKAVESLGKELESNGGIDILINNAGLMPLSPLLECRIDEWERMVDVNIKGVLYVLSAVLPGMAKRKSGHIVNISSVAGRFTMKGMAVYSGTKFAVRAISDGLRREATEYGVRVTDIEPGAVDTELIDSIKYEPIRKAATAPGGFHAPGRIILKSEDIAAAIVYAVTQPDRVDVSELLIRPQNQEF